MHTYDIPTLMKHLTAEFATVDGMSVALSGSLARGDVRTTTGGHITSDLDLIPVIPTRADVPAARALLAPILQRIADTFAIEATAAITLEPAFTAAIHAPYRTSIRGNWLCNGLSLPQPTLPPEPHTLPDDPEGRLAWLVQPVTYYLSKARICDPQTNIIKARTAARRLRPHLGDQAPGPLDDLPRTLRNLFTERRIKPLQSSAAYLNAPTRPNHHQAVRDLVFSENQGLTFAESALVAHPSVPN
ncbi:hypothetical protein [Streptomyces sp. NPDC001546]|uniref:hypothetical protein n=1 Tax=Streptomyces sp. NPDC001546 TaxID=3364585 RepID=UPI00369A22B7